jgi:hypothetical protein
MKRAIYLVVRGRMRAQTTVNGGRDYKGTLKASGSVSAVDFSSAAATAPARAGTTAARPRVYARADLFRDGRAGGAEFVLLHGHGDTRSLTQMSGSTAGGGGGAATFHPSSPGQT